MSRGGCSTPVTATRKPERSHERPEMALADRLQDKAREATGRPCSVGQLLDKLPKSEHDALHAMMYELGWSWSKIQEALQQERHLVSGQQINRHRSQACRCWTQS